MISRVKTGDPHAGWPLYVGKDPVGTVVTAYACRGYACLEPTRDPCAWREQVSSGSAEPARPPARALEERDLEAGGRAERELSERHGVWTGSA